VKLVLLVSLSLLVTLGAVVLVLTVSPAAGAIAMGAVLFGGAIVLLAGSNAESTTYHCPDCGHDFKISGATELLSPHTPNSKHLLCPQCDKFVWAEARTSPAEQQRK